MKKNFEQLRKTERGGSLEKELKYHLERRDYLKLLRVFCDKKPRQDRLTTYYFDDDKLRLRKRKFGFRVRTVNGKRAIVTLKYPAKAPRGKSPMGFKVRHEYEEDIPLRQAKALLAGRETFANIDIAPVRLLRQAFSKAYLEKLELLGALRTLRTLVPLGRKLEMEIDSCSMFGKRFYELEIETEDAQEADRRIRNLLKRHEIVYQPLTQSKLGRFLEEWKRQRADR